MSSRGEGNKPKIKHSYKNSESVTRDNLAQLRHDKKSRLAQ